jgi:hypothetical protein
LSCIDTAPVEGSVFSLLECHRGVDVLDEWALLPRLSQFPVVVVPEQERMSQKMVDALKQYVRAGGKLLVAGAAVFDRFGNEFLGVKGSRVESRNYFLPSGDCVIPLSTAWRLIEPAGATSFKKLATSLFLDRELSVFPAATLHRLGRGAVAYIPCNIFREFAANRYPPLRVYTGEVLHALTGKMEIEVAAPTCVDVVLRRKDAKRIVHLINRSSGLPNLPNSGVIDEIPPVGPITITMNLHHKPKNVSLAFEKAALTWDDAEGPDARRLKIDVVAVHIHAAVVVEVQEV